MSTHAWATYAEDDPPGLYATEDQWFALRLSGKALGWSRAMTLAWVAAKLDGHPETLLAAEADGLIEELCGMRGTR